MSGGKYEYACFRIAQLADDIECNKDATMTLLREWFVEHLRLVSDAANDIEWVDSYDYGEGREVVAIVACAEHGKKVPL